MNQGPQERRRAAVHEAGHVVVARSLGLRVTRFSMDGTDAFTSAHVEVSLPAFKSMTNTLDALRVYAGGAAAEAIVFGDPAGLTGGDRVYAEAIVRIRHGLEVAEDVVEAEIADAIVRARGIGGQHRVNLFHQGRG